MKILQPQWGGKLGLDKTGMAAVGAPVSFSAGATAIAAGQTVPLNLVNLQSGYRTPYWVDEIRMQVYSGSSVDAGTFGVQAGGYMMQFQFRTGNYAFSKTPIPMALYAPQYGASALIGQETGSLDIVGHSVRWVLPKPLFMAPGDQIQCNVTRLSGVGAYGGAGFNADVAYVGRALPPGTTGPNARCVPWVANYIHDFANAYSETQAEFRNPFMVPLYVHRFVGRPGSKSSTGAPDLSNGIAGGDFATQFNMLPTSTGIKYASVYIEDSLGYKIVAGPSNAYSPVGCVFDTERCAWTFGRPLGPREQFNMKFATNGSASGTNSVFGVGMVGYREEAV